MELTIFGTPDIHTRCHIRNASGRGVGLELAAPLASGAAIKITLEDAILLGEVIYCRQQDGKWYAGVELEHALCGLSSLAPALCELKESASGAQRQDAVQHTGRQNEQQSH